MKKRVLALLLCGLLMLGLAACGGGGTTTPSSMGTGNATQGQGGSSEPGGQSGTNVQGLALKEYTDREFGYSLLAPDLWSDEYTYSQRWVLQDKNDDNLVLFAYTEYHDGSSYFAEGTAELTDPKEIPAHFMSAMCESIGSKTGTTPKQDIIGIQWKEMTIGGFAAAEFRGTIDCSKAGILGITGICVVGEKRSYAFWALDLSKDQSYLDMAQEVLETCVANFKEGS